MRTRATAPRPNGRRRSRAFARTATPPLAHVALPLLAAVSIAALGSVGASAATLGGLTTSDIGATGGVVAAHPSGLSAQWLPVRSGSNWLLNGITLSSAAAEPFVDGERIKVSIIGTSGVVICEVPIIHAGIATSATIARGAIDAACGAAGISFLAIDRVAVSAGS